MTETPPTSERIKRKKIFQAVILRSNQITNEKVVKEVWVQQQANSDKFVLPTYEMKFHSPQADEVSGSHFLTDLGVVDQKSGIYQLPEAFSGTSYRVIYYDAQETLPDNLDKKITGQWQAVKGIESKLAILDIQTLRSVIAETETRKRN